MLNKRRIIEIISENLNVCEEAISDDTVFEDDLGVDSLDMAEVYLALESEFQIKIANGDFFEILTVGDMVKHINMLL